MKKTKPEAPKPESKKSKKEPYFFAKLKKMEIKAENLEPLDVLGGSCPIYAMTGAGCNADYNVLDASAPED